MKAFFHFINEFTYIILFLLPIVNIQEKFPVIIYLLVRHISIKLVAFFSEI